MGTEAAATTKPTKANTSQQEQQQHPPPPSNTPSYTEWAAAFQAYYGSAATPPPPGYYPSSVASGPQPHPYIWAGQPLIPYGTPHAAMYPYGGIYAHPSMAPGAHPYAQYGMSSLSTEMTVGPTANIEGEQKSSEGRERNGTKRSKGSLGNLDMFTGKGSKDTKATSGSMSGHSHSGDSDGSSEGSEETTQNGSQPSHNLNHDHSSMDGSHMADAYGGHAVGNSLNHGNPTAMSGKPAGLTTNLNIGMDYWNGSTTSPLARGKRNISSMSMALVPASSSPQLIVGGQDGVHGELWLQDERELKRQRRKQSNRESARRSRLRKQAECEELNTRVDNLTVENMALRTELNRLAEECKKLSAENASLLAQLREVQSVGLATEDGEEPGGHDIHLLGYGGRNSNSREEGRGEQLVCETADRSASQLECVSASNPVEAVAAG